MKKIQTLLLLLISALTMSAQRVDPILTQLLQKNKQTIALAKSNRLKRIAPQTVNGIDTLAIKRRINVRFHPDGSIRQLCILATLANRHNCPYSQLQALGIKVICTVGQLVILDVPAESFAALSMMTEFKRLTADRVHKPNNDIARTTNNVSYVTGETSSPMALDTKYDGTGVIVGVIDQGIDFNHVAFKDEKNGATRIKHAIYFTDDSDKPIIVTGADIDQLTTGCTETSHGTHTSAIAAGSYIGTIHKQGMAPGADLVLADCSNSLTASHIINSANAIVEYAKQEGKPCVINVSIGDNEDFHDGTDEVSQAFNELSSSTENHCIFVLSAGNEADKQMSIRKTLNNGETIKTIMGTPRRWGNTNCVNYEDALEAIIYSLDGNDFLIQFSVVDVTNGKTYTLEEKPLVDDNEKPIFLYTTGAYLCDNNKYGYRILESACHFTEPNLRLVVTVTASADNQSFIIVSTHQELVGKKTTRLDGYTDGNADMSINCFACSDGVISVGSYTDRDRWQDIDGIYRSIPFYSKPPIGTIAADSSYGVDDNGKARPDILAPGIYIISAFNSYDDAYFAGEDINCREPKNAYAKTYITHKLQGEGIGDGQRPYYYGSKYGTSMAAPMVTGIIALWLQKNPSLTTDQVRQLLHTTSIQDQYTTIATNIPSGNLVQAGSGKIDALQGILALDNVTSITTHPIPSPALTDIYDLSGRKVTNPQKGMYIMGGKKILIR